MMRFSLSPKNTLIVRGPAEITLLDGQATILAAPLVPGLKKVVAGQKQIPIETETRADLEINLRKHGEIFENLGSTIPASWKLAAETLRELRDGKVVLLGQPDVGKSTLCVYLTNKLLQNGQSLGILDADIGQSDLGPPTTIAYAVSRQPIISLQELIPERKLFIGRTSPTGVERKLTKAIHRLSKENTNQLTIVNTDGWIADLSAILHKINLLTEIEPEIVLGLTFANELEPILGSVRFHSLRVEASREVLERSRLDRRAIRAEGYRRFLEGAGCWNISLEQTHTSFPRLGRITASNRRGLIGLIVGILDRESYLLEIGILTGLEHDVATIYSRRPGTFHSIEVGYVRLSRSGREIGTL